MRMDFYGWRPNKEGSLSQVGKNHKGTTWRLSMYFGGL